MLNVDGMCMNTDFFFQRTHRELADREEIFSEFDKKWTTHLSTFFDYLYFTLVFVFLGSL